MVLPSLPDPCVIRLAQRHDYHCQSRCRDCRYNQQQGNMASPASCLPPAISIGRTHQKPVGRGLWEGWFADSTPAIQRNTGMELRADIWWAELLQTFFCSTNLPCSFPSRYAFPSVWNILPLSFYGHCFLLFVRILSADVTSSIHLSLLPTLD